MPNVDEILGGAREAITVRRVFGDPVEHEGTTVVPVASVRGGGGGGGDAEGNGGGGFGVSASPAGVYVIADGNVTWKPAVNPNRIVLGWQLVSALAVLAAWAVGRRVANAK
jgi:uncharacterized spore protein YtfJ